MSSPFKGVALLAAFLAAFAVLSPSAQAQVALSLEVNNANYIQYEPIYAKLTLRNFSARPLAFGAAKELSGSLKFEIQGPDGSYVESKGDMEKPLLGTILMPGASKSLVLIVSTRYRLQKLGKYRIKAFVEHPQLPSAYESNVAFFTVIKGNKVLDRVVGLPDFSAKPDAAKDKVKTRTYSIYDFFDGRNKVYAITIEDAHMVYAVKRLGFDMGSNLQPKVEIDSISRCHILLPASPKVFAYYVFGVDGKLEKRDIFMKTSTVPTMVADKKDGSVMVVGGRAARKDIDYDEYKDLPFMGDLYDKPQSETEIDEEEKEAK
jgi:hypothetical protein